MKKWVRPMVTELSIHSTEAGGLGGAGDGVVYVISGYHLIGTSGPELPLPKV